MIRNTLAALALASAIATPSAGDPSWSHQQWTEHCQASTQTEAEMYACFEAATAEVDAALEATLARWLTSVEDGMPQDQAEHEAVIRESFAARRALGELECTDETFISRRGTGYGTIFAHCLLGKRIEHLRYLEKLAEYY